MKSRNSQRIKMADKEEVQVKAANTQAGILIASDHPIVHKGLVELISGKPDIGICIEAENTNQYWATISKQQIDLAIIDISSKDSNGFKLADRVKLQCPKVPIVLLSVYDEALHAENTLQAKTTESLFNREATEQIIKAIRYVQSLLRNKIFGFTLALRIERSLQNNH